MPPPQRILIVCGDVPAGGLRFGHLRTVDLVIQLRRGGWETHLGVVTPSTDPSDARAFEAQGVPVHVVGGAELAALLEAGYAAVLFASWQVAELLLATVRRAAAGAAVLIDCPALGFAADARRMLEGADDMAGLPRLHEEVGSELMGELSVYAAAETVLTGCAEDARMLAALLRGRPPALWVPDTSDPGDSSMALASRRGVVVPMTPEQLELAKAGTWRSPELVSLVEHGMLKRDGICIAATAPPFAPPADLPRGVTMVGVPSLRPLIERARVLAVTSSDDVGSRRAAVASILAGTPVVAPRPVARALRLREDLEVLVADEPVAWAGALRRLGEDDELWHRLAAAGRRRLERDHGMDAVLSRLLRALRGAHRHRARHHPVEGSRERLGLRLRRRHRWETLPAMRETVRRAVPEHGRVLIFTDGLDELLRLDGRTVVPFPDGPDGRMAPGSVSSERLIELLQAEIHAGADVLVVPRTAETALSMCPGFRDHLTACFPLEKAEHCSIVRLGGVARAARARLVAFYLPQFHPIPENDRWWGPGFTEWTNVARARPLFTGHYQPHVPADLGFYDLRLSDTREAQARLARDAGISAFCWYHYWFGGRRLLERPFNEVLASGRPDFPFCLCWANEPWSRSWDGSDSAVLQPQVYSRKDDLAHIRWLLPALADRRAMTVGGRPVFLIYRARDLPEPARTLEVWREEARRAGLPELHLLAVQTDRDAGWDATRVGFDATVAFQPRFSVLHAMSPADVEAPEAARVWDYRKAVERFSGDPLDERCYETVCAGWDNSPRRGQRGRVLHDADPEAYGRYLAAAISRAERRPQEERLVFINAWNEWAEGAHLEPDRRHGHGYLRATRAALDSVAALAARDPGPPGRIRVETSGGLNGASAASEHGDAPARLIALYLPQFHPIAENDEWWGPGFTEWTNVAQAQPLFPGHYQPHLPADLGFYDLRLPESREAQADLARAHGIEAFCYWHYWFGGRRLLHTPFDETLRSGRPAFPFCLAWANESWSRRWLGQTEDVLVRQDYSPKDDREHARWLREAFADPRYLRVYGRPLFLVYRPKDLPDPRRFTDVLRAECSRSRLPEPFLLGVNAWRDTDYRALGFDGTLDFEPRLSALGNPGAEDLNVHDYEEARAAMRTLRDYAAYPCVMVSWDNTPRRGAAGTVLTGSTPEAFGRGLRQAIDDVRNRPAEERLVFINAWNEWAEGNHLEPDQRHGLGYLRAVRDAVDGGARPDVAMPSGRVVARTGPAIRGRA